MHERQVIRDWFIARISSAAELNNVFSSRTYPIEKGKTPGVIVYTTEEETIPSSMGASNSTIRLLTVVVEIYEKGVAQIDDRVDEVALIIETMISQCDVLNEVSSVEYTGFSTEYTGGDNSFLVGTMTYTVTYWTNAEEVVL